MAAQTVDTSTTTEASVPIDLSKCPTLHCSITRDIMRDPVTTADGHTFERWAIEQWLSTSNISPLTGLVLANKLVKPNHALRSIIKEFTLTTAVDLNIRHRYLEFLGSGGGPVPDDLVDVVWHAHLCLRRYDSDCIARTGSRVIHVR